ncbi:hypothetical protein LINPERHAP1_LOCUS31571, partial [Linum perenne]
DSCGQSITKYQYQSLYSLFQGHNSASEVLGSTLSVHYVAARKRTRASSSIPAVELYISPPRDGGPSVNNNLGNLHLYDSSGDWVVDFGATDHVAYSLRFLHSSKLVQGVSVRLPDGGFISVTHIRTVLLRHNLMLDHVLVIPSFKFNILSISILTEHNAYKVIFSSSLCTFQDTRNSQTIGTAELCRGLYWLRSSDHFSPGKNVVSSCSSTFFDL